MAGKKTNMSMVSKTFRKGHTPAMRQWASREMNMAKKRKKK